MPTTHDAIPDARNEHVLVYVSGRFVSRSEARVSVFDSAFTVGDGIWEGMRLHRGVIVFLDRHLDRLFSAIDTTGIDPGWTRAEITSLLYEVARRNAMTDGVHIRLMISRGEKKTPSQHPSNLVGGPTVVILAEHKQPSPESATGITLHTSAVRRPPPETLDQRLNTHSKIHEVLALREAQAHGADEALMLDVEGFVATCNATNFFAVVDGTVWTSTGEHCLPGITRSVVIEQCRDAGIPIRAEPFELELVHGGDEAFVTGTFGGITPVRSVDGHPLRACCPGPITSRLDERYRRAVEADVARRSPGD